MAAPGVAPGGASGALFDESRPATIPETAAETKELRDRAELYAIMREAEALEDVLARSDIDVPTYREAAARLLRSFDTQLKAQDDIKDIHVFMNEYGIKLRKATQLLVINKVPTTDIHATTDSRADALLCSETTGALITAMDAVRLGQMEVDQLVPFLRAAHESLNKHTWLGRDFEPKMRLLEWLQRLNAMSASDSISERDGRQIAHDLQQCYDGFISKLEERTSRK